MRAVRVVDCVIPDGFTCFIWLHLYLYVGTYNSGLYKNLLQELVQKEGFSLPVYGTNRSGEVHEPIFFLTVVIGEVFKGHEARTKKQVEMNAAKIAYTTLKERKFIFLSTLLVSGLVLTLSKPFSF